MRDLESHGVNLRTVCKELRVLRSDPELNPLIKADATKLFKQALREKLNFPEEVSRWDDTAVEMYLEIIISIG